MNRDITFTNPVIARKPRPMLARMALTTTLTIRNVPIRGRPLRGGRGCSGSAERLLASLSSPHLGSLAFLGLQLAAESFERLLELGAQLLILDNLVDHEQRTVDSVNMSPDRLDASRPPPE